VKWIYAALTAALLGGCANTRNLPNNSYSIPYRSSLPSLHTIIQEDVYNPNIPRQAYHYNRNFEIRNSFFESEVQNYSQEFTERELRIVLKASREIVRQLALDYCFFRTLNRYLNNLEKLADRVGDFEDAIQQIWTLDLTDPVEDLRNPFRNLEYAIQGVPKKTSSNISARLEPTINQQPLGGKSSTHLFDALRGKKVDWGFQLRIKIEF